MTNPTTGPLKDSEDPWNTFSWILASIWLIFLMFPLLAALNAPELYQQVLGAADVIAFGVVYWFGNARTMKQGIGIGNREAWYYFAALMALMLLGFPILGLNALGMSTFVVAFVMFNLPFWWGIGISIGLVLGLAGATALIAGREGPFFLSAISAAVLFTCGFTRIAISRSERYEETKQQLALTADRERVARDVHDVLGHTLTVIAAKSELAERLLDRDLERARAELTDIHDLTREAIAEVRTTVGGLRSKQLADELQAAEVALTSADVNAHITEAEQVDPRNRVLFAWIVREAVTNIVRHARATNAWVQVEAGELVIEDDGRGLGGKAPGNGLHGLTERVSEAGGDLTLGERPGGGTRLTVTMGPT